MKDQVAKIKKLQKPGSKIVKIRKQKFEKLQKTRLQKFQKIAKTRQQKLQKADSKNANIVKPRSKK